MSSHDRIPELESIEFKGSKSIADYSTKGRNLLRDIAWEFHESSEEVKAALSRQKGHPLLFGLDVRIRARRVAARLQRASEGAVGVAAELVKFNAEYKRQFVEPAQEAKRRQRKNNWEM